MKNISRRLFLGSAAAAAGLTVLPALPKPKIVSMLSKLHMPGLFTKEPWIMDVSLIADYPAGEFRVEVLNEDFEVGSVGTLNLKDIQKAMDSDIFAVETMVQVKHSNQKPEEHEMLMGKNLPGAYGGDFRLWLRRQKSTDEFWLRGRDIGIVLSV